MQSTRARTLKLHRRAEIALDSLPAEQRGEVLQRLSAAPQRFFDPIRDSFGKNHGEPLLPLSLDDQLSAIVRVDGDEVTVVDVVNRDAMRLLAGLKA